MADVHKFSSTQFNLPADLAKQVKEHGKKIPNFALYGDGRENESHVTLLWGIEVAKPDAAIRNAIGMTPAFKIKLGKTSHFPDSGDGDVVKVDIHSPELHAMHHKLASVTPTTKTHPDYIPHCTVAYCKPGLGRTFSGSSALEGKEAIVDKIIFSSKDGSRETIPLLGAKGPMGRYKRR